MSRRALLLLLAGGIMIFTVLLLRSRVSEPPTGPVVPMQARRVVIARHDLIVGSFVQGAQDLDWGTVPDVRPGAVPASELPLPASAAKDDYLYEGSVKLSDFNGAVVRRFLHAGEPVPRFAIMKSGEGGFLSAVLEPGMRAVSISVNATSGNAGFVSPGDHIDLIVTHRVKLPQASNGAGNDEFIVSETFVRDARVVAVDQMLDNPDNKAILAKTVTVEVTPHQAEEVAVAADMGKISIALRSLSAGVNNAVAGNGQAQAAGRANERANERDIVNVNQPGGILSSGNLSEMLHGRQMEAPRVHIFHGDKMENMDFDQDKQ